MNKSCFGCYYEHNNKCYWFKLVNNSTPKAIPEDTLQKGCKQYKNNNRVKSESELLRQVIEVFNGEIIGEKYVPTYKTYKKKYVKSSHNYTYRKDAQ